MNISTDTIKKNLKWIVCAVLSLFHFIWLCLPCLTISYSFFGVSSKTTVSGWKIFEAVEGSDLAIVAFLQTITLIVAIALLAGSAYLLVSKLLGKNLPESFGPVNVQKITSLIYIVYAILTVLTWILCLIVGLANSGSGLTIAPGFGAYLIAILSVGSIFGLRFLGANDAE